MPTPASILLTRSLDISLLPAFQNREVHLDAIPFISTSLVHTPEVRQQLDGWAGQPVLALFTSSRAVEAVASLLPQWPLFWQAACVGAVTATTIRRCWPHATISQVAHDAAALAQSTIAAHADLPAVHFCGQRRMPTLQQAFAAAGRPLAEVVLYQTQLCPQRVNRSYSAVLFCSPSAVESFFSVNSVERDCQLLAIGGSTAAAVMRFANRPAEAMNAASIEAFIEMAIAKLRPSVAGSHTINSL